MTQPDAAQLDHALQEALAHHRAGRLSEAEQGYRRILMTRPGHAEANHNLGVLIVTSQQPAASLEYFVAALEADPAHGPYWLSYIDALIRNGQRDAAREVLAMAKGQGLQGKEVDELARRLQEDGSRQVAQAAKEKGKAGKQPQQKQIDQVLAMFNAGRLAEVIAQAQELAQRYPQHEFGWKALGAALTQLGRTADALLPMQQAAALAPGDAQAHSNLAITLQDLGRLDEAEASLRRALAIDSRFVDAHINLGALLQSRGKLEEAEATLRQAIQLRPAQAEAHYNLGNTLHAQGKLNEAEACYRRAVQCRPDYAPAWSNLGMTLDEQGQGDAALASLRQALQLKPDFAEASNNLGRLLQERGQLDEAEACYQRALQLRPQVPEIHNNFGNLLQDMGRLDEAAARYRQALQLNPDYLKAHSNLLFLLNYSATVDRAQALAEAHRYGQSVHNKVASPFTNWVCERQATRLRIGMVSGDLRNHPVGYFLENLLRHLDRDAFELIAYATDAKQDALSARIRPYFSAWKPLYGLDDEAAAQLIHRDAVHILIDLSGHTRYNRLPLFAWKPAPVQVAWLGYFATTGLREMDWLIADPWTLPESEERYFTEKIWRLPETRLCFTAPEAQLDVAPLPALANGCITFGCFNNLTKMNDAVVSVWAKILSAVPHSRLFLKSRQLIEASQRRQVEARFAAHGIPAERLLLEGAEPRAQYLAAYHRVDISLDPFPYPGGTTTVESLWMGVPVLTLAGDSFLFRQGLGLLMNAGLPEWVATGEDDYVARAVQLAGDVQALARLRQSLRQQVEASPVMDGVRFARHFAAALQGVWQSHLNDQAA